MTDFVAPSTNQTAPVDGATNQSLAWAHRYAAKGWRVLPIIPGEKRPALNAWQNAATTDASIIETWWTTSYPDHGVGIATGQESGIFVLDVDVAGGKRGQETLQELTRRHGELPPTPLVFTPSGGWHVYFQWPEGQEIRNDASRRLGPGLDIRGEGGQVVAPPTTRSEGGYQWFENTFTMQAPNAPAWLIELLTVEHAPVVPPIVASTSSGDDGPAQRYNERTNWTEILAADGWTCAEMYADGEQRWVRPGKDECDGISATVGHEGRDILTVFTTSLEWLPDGSYSRFGYYACRFHGGDRSAAASALRSEDFADVDAALASIEMVAPRTAPETTERTVDRILEMAHLIEWHQFWSQEHLDEDWLAYPVIPRGRAIALYAPAKAGKSTIVLAIAAAAATGRPVLGQRSAEPVETLYLDYEMSEADLQQRLEELGYGENDDLSHLHYALLPSMPGLDTPEGAQHLLHLVDAIGAQLVVIDTFGRAVLGEEDAADTVRDFYNHTGRELKQRKLSYLRTDHTGKDTKKGMRGSSAKNDDVDVVWRLERADVGGGHVVKMTRTHSRISWVPEELIIKRVETDDGADYVLDLSARVYPDGTADDMHLLIAAGVTSDDSQPSAGVKKKEAGIKMSTPRLRQALAMLKGVDPLASIGGKPVEKRAREYGARAGGDSDETRFADDGARSDAPPMTSENARGASRGASGATESVQLGRDAPLLERRSAPAPAPSAYPNHDDDLF